MSAAAKTETLGFEALGARRLYEVLRLRSAVFVVEQDCVYQDLDDRDHDALHVLVTDHRGIVAYTRLLAPGVAYAIACSIGRVISAPAARGEGLGQRVMRYSIEQCRRRYPGTDILIHGQSYLLDFYRRLGFVAEGAEYLEDGIPHHTMRLSAS